MKFFVKKKRLLTRVRLFCLIESPIHALSLSLKSCFSLQTDEWPAAKIVNLRKVFRASRFYKSSNDKIAVKDVCFTFDEGSLLALLGQNGAGKTTTMNVKKKGWEMGGKYISYNYYSLHERRFSLVFPLHRVVMHFYMDSASTMKWPKSMS